MADTVDNELLLRRFARERKAREAAEALIEQKSLELYEARIAAEAASQAKSEFLAIMGHELRTPLNAIIGFSQMILQEPYGEVGSAKYLEFLRDIEESGEKLLSVINDILYISNLAQSGGGPEGTWCELKDLVVGVTLKADRAAENRNISIVKPDNFPKLAIKGDFETLGRALHCIVDNAVKFSPDGGAVVLDVAEMPDGRLSISVQDQGQGISPENIENIFQPFFQCDTSLGRGHEGAGLGLTIAKAIFTMHGASISVRSKPGQGSNFTIIIRAANIAPLDQRENRPARQNRAATS